MGDVLLHCRGTGPDAAANRLHRGGEDQTFDLFGVLATGDESRDDAELRVEERLGLETGSHKALIKRFEERLTFLESALLLCAAGRLKLAEQFGVGADDLGSRPEVFLNLAEDVAGGAPGVDELDEARLG
ncbi:MAG: hypothetical protein NWR21_09835 [Verrucomicrobiales bacterium]|nr:hypothetical protein [Verrucomicrobiales bacterium]